MIDLDIVNDEIMALEERETSYAVIQKLAWLYTVRDHISDDSEEMTEELGTGRIK